MSLVIHFLGAFILLATLLATDAGAQSQPAVDGVNAKVSGFGGGASQTDGFYGGFGSVSVPIANQWGVQVDAGAVGKNGGNAFGGAGHLFWRDPAKGMVGLYGSYSQWNAHDIAGAGRVSANVGRLAGAAEYYRDRWTLSAYAGVETVHVDASTLLTGQICNPARFFDAITASYYPADNIKLSLGQMYVFGRNGVTFNGEYGMPLGGGRMASFFAGGALREGGNAVALAGLRLYLASATRA